MLGLHYGLDVVVLMNTMIPYGRQRLEEGIGIYKKKTLFRVGSQPVKRSNKRRGKKGSSALRVFLNMRLLQRGTVENACKEPGYRKRPQRCFKSTHPVRTQCFAFNFYMCHYFSSWFLKSSNGTLFFMRAKLRKHTKK